MSAASRFLSPALPCSSSSLSSSTVPCFWKACLSSFYLSYLKPVLQNTETYCLAWSFNPILMNTATGVVARAWAPSSTLCLLAIISFKIAAWLGALDMLASVYQPPICSHLFCLWGDIHYATHYFYRPVGSSRSTTESLAHDREALRDHENVHRPLLHDLWLLYIIGTERQLRNWMNTL